MKRLIAPLLLFAACSAHAQTLPEDLVRAELLPGWQTETGNRMAALHVTLAPGWKTYWRSPGEAGIPPVFDWTGSANLGAVRFHWPRPAVVEIAGYRTLVYPGEMVLPIEITPADPAAPVTLVARVDMGVCDQVCVPVTLQVRTDAPPEPAGNLLIETALAAVPDSAPALGLEPARCAAEPIRDGLRLSATLPLPAGPQDFAVIELADGAVWVAPVETRAGAELVQVADLVPPDAQPFALDRAQVRLTAFAGGQVIEFLGCRG